MLISKEDLVNILIQYAESRFEKYDKARGANISSFLHMVMSRYCYQLWKIADKRVKKEVNDSTTITDEQPMVASDIHTMEQWNTRDGYIIRDNDFMAEYAKWWNEFQPKKHLDYVAKEYVAKILNGDAKHGQDLLSERTKSKISELLRAKKLITCVSTKLKECWIDKGELPAHEVLLPYFQSSMLDTTYTHDGKIIGRYQYQKQWRDKKKDSRQSKLDYLKAYHKKNAERYKAIRASGRWLSKKQKKRLGI
jgi:hypothetical protein